MANGLTFGLEGPVARITLDREEMGNALDIPMARALMEAAIACDENDAIRCVLMTGRGRLFCAGGDIAAFNAAGDQLPAFLKEITAYLHLAIARLARMNKPLVTAVNGPAAGAGFSLAILGDIVLAAPAAHFTLAYTAIGFSPDGGATWLLPRLIGLRQAQELVLRNRRVKAAEAAALGLITRVVAEGALEPEAMALAQELAQSATSALGASRRLLLDSFSTSIETQMEQESRAIAGQARTPEGREGVAAFVEKRRPNFLKEN
jgi:2-(1,2-epoxy-1,2-dihydrophenyl)acetyl-CoA isomerase